MPSFLTEVDFEVYCASCGAGLCNQSSTEERKGRLRVVVEPCEKCKEMAEYSGYDRGHKDGYEEGVSESTL